MSAALGARDRVRAQSMATPIYKLPCGHELLIDRVDACTRDGALIPSVTFTWPPSIWVYQHEHIRTLRKLGAPLPPPNCYCYYLAGIIRLHGHRYSTAIDRYVEKIAEHDRTVAVAHADVLKMLRARAATRLARDTTDLPIEMRLATRLNKIVTDAVRECGYSVISRQCVVLTCLTRTPSVSLRRGIDVFFGDQYGERDEDIRAVVRLGLPRGWLARARECIHQDKLIIDERADARLLLVERLQHLYLEWVPR